jgi:hypothetical protein
MEASRAREWLLWMCLFMLQAAIICNLASASIPREQVRLTAASLVCLDKIILVRLKYKYSTNEW